MKQKGLGRGLDAIFGSDPVDAKLKPMSRMAEIEIADIIPNPTQPRTQFDEEALDELADSIRQLGVIQPVTVKKADGRQIRHHQRRTPLAGRAARRPDDPPGLHPRGGRREPARHGPRGEHPAPGPQRHRNRAGHAAPDRRVPPHAGRPFGEGGQEAFVGVELPASAETPRRGAALPSKRD